MPHGPDHAVRSQEAVAIQGPPGSLGGAGRTSFSECPESVREKSGSGPWGPIFLGVWQSWQPMIRARYLPCSMAGSGAAGALALPGVSPASALVSKVGERAIRLIATSRVRFMVSFL